MTRLYNLDYLRGLAAFGIMIYHLLSWTSGHFTADSFIGRIGVYGVSVFYVLSGLTLYYVYYNKMESSWNDVVKFFKKRIFRIFPLLWLVTIVVIILSHKLPNFLDLTLNLTGLFGFLKWDSYFATGAWSIGNELVFYTFFPFFVLFLKSNKPLFILFSVALFSLYLQFTFQHLNPELTLAEQWRTYVNPLNQVFYFLGGFLIGVLFHNRQLNNTVSFILLFSGLTIFTFYPVSGDHVNLVTGTNRIIFTSCCFLICISFYKLSFNFPDLVHKPLARLGEASYSVYLLHPIVFSVTLKFTTLFTQYIFPLSIYVTISLSIILTLITSHYVYQKFEKYFMKFGRTNKNKIAIERSAPVGSMMLDRTQKESLKSKI